MIGQFVFVLFDIRKGAIEPLLLASEQHKADGAARPLPGMHDGFGSSEGCCGPRAIVCSSLGQVPGIEVPADD